MAEGFEYVQSPYKITAVSRNDFSDGKLRIEPPIHMTVDDLNDYVGDEYGVEFLNMITGKEATLVDIVTCGPDEHSSNRGYYGCGGVLSRTERVKASVADIAGTLAMIANNEVFIEQYVGKVNLTHGR